MSTCTTSVVKFAKPISLNEAMNDPAQAQPARDVKDRGRTPEGAKETTNQFSKEQKDPLACHQPKVKPGITFAAQDKLLKLPIPELNSTLKKYVAALKPLQSAREHSDTIQAVEEFKKNEGPELQERLKKYATGKTSYIEQFCKSPKTRHEGKTDRCNRVRFISEL
jgi:carnitine O-acetyltransferase